MMSPTKKQTHNLSNFSF